MDETRRQEIDALLRDAKSSLRTRERFKVLALLLPLGLALAGLLIGISRFTLLELPRWSPLVPVLAMVAGAFAWAATREVSHSQAAAYLDRAWGLDERLSTLTQLERRRAFTVLRPGDDLPLNLVAEDAWYAARKSNRQLPWVPRFEVSRSTLAGIALGAGMLLFALFAASPADRVRAEIASAQEALAAQLQQIAALRTEIEQLGIPENLKNSMLTELNNLEKALQAAGPDKSALRAALGDAQSKIGALTPERVNQWGEIIRASQALQEMARRTVLWQPPEVDDLTDLSSGALAAEAIGTGVDRVSVGLQAEMAQELDSLSRLVLAKSRTLATAFEEGSVSLYGRNMSRASQAFDAMAEELRRLEKRELSAQAVEQALARLEDGKQELLKDHSPEKRAQVGFNRGDRTPEQAGEESGGATSQPNAGAEGEGATATDGATGLDGGRSGVPGASAGSGETQQGSGTSPNTTGGAVEGDGPLQPVGPNAQPGGANGESSRGEAGTLDAPVAGNPGTVSGGITRVENPQGVGTGQSGQAGPTAGPNDRVYVPQAVPGARGSSEGGVNSGSEGAPAPMLPDSASTAGSEEEGSAVGGKLTEIRTPYREVLREYAERATEALENTFVPADARKLVRDYFSALGQ